jgi:phosphoglycolate phosphatase-like HAD superfamily hydrolase
MKKLVIFDIDGTLTDSVSLYHKVVIDALQLMGIGKIDTDFYHYKYHTDSYTLKFNYENFFNKPISDELMLQFEYLLEEELKKYPPVQEIRGAKECVTSLLKSDIAIAFATGSLPKPAMLKLKQCDIWHDQNLIATSKISYDRETFVLQAIENAKNYFNIEHFENIISVGDGIWDLQTAKRLNLEFIGVGNKQKEALLNLGCKTHFEDLTKLATYLI